MFNFIKTRWRKSRHKKLFALGTTGIVILISSGLVTGGLIWHEKPSFCSVCHTPMKSYVEGYNSGDKTLMITPHATGKSVLHDNEEILTITKNTMEETSLSCLDCHEPTIKEQLTEASHWITGNYYFPLEQREFGTRSFCLSADCHAEADIIEATKDYGGAKPFNQHDPRHGKQECNRCHSVHGKSVFLCNQCHKLELPDGWVCPSVTGVVTIE